MNSLPRCSRWLMCASPQCQPRSRTRSTCKPLWTEAGPVSGKSRSSLQFVKSTLFLSCSEGSEAWRSVYEEECCFSRPCRIEPVDGSGFCPASQDDGTARARRNDDGGRAGHDVSSDAQKARSDD